MGTRRDHVTLATVIGAAVRRAADASAAQPSGRPLLPVGKQTWRSVGPKSLALTRTDGCILARVGPAGPGWVAWREYPKREYLGMFLSISEAQRAASTEFQL